MATILADAAPATEGGPGGGGEARGGGDSGHFPKAPKRSRGQPPRVLLQRRSSAPDALEAAVAAAHDGAGGSEDAVTAGAVAAAAAATPAVGSRAVPGVEDVAIRARPLILSKRSAPPPKAAPDAVAEAPSGHASTVPSWARWPSTGRGGRPSERPGDSVDLWASAPGAPFERICIGFQDMGKTVGDEASTHDGGAVSDEVFGAEPDDMDVFSDLEEELQQLEFDSPEPGEVVIGYRADVGLGHNLPPPEDAALDPSALPGVPSGTLEEGAAGGGLSAEEGSLIGDGTGEEEGLGASASPGAAAAGAGGAAKAGGAAGAAQDQDGLATSQHPGEKVTQILFIVHGMGATPGGLRRNVSDLSANFLEMQKYWYWHTNINVHVEMIDWKSSMNEVQFSIFDRITPADARSTRLQLNSTLSDVIFYKTVHHRTRIHNVVVERLNARHRALRADPSGRFENASVSIVGHSLGSVIAYDVLSCRGGEEGLPSLGLPSLDFKVDNFFLWGSPLAAFISIADIEHQSGKFTLPRTLSTHNIYHPHDPVAFRLEPLYFHSEEQAPPELVAYWANDGMRASKQWAKSFELAKGVAQERWTTLTSRFWEALGSVPPSGSSSSSAPAPAAAPTRSGRTPPHIFTEAGGGQWELLFGGSAGGSGSAGAGGGGAAAGPGREGAGGEPPPARPGADPASGSDCGASGGATAASCEGVLEHQGQGPMRLDYALQELAVETFSDSYGMLFSHFCYWNSRDVGLFMLKRMSRQGVAEVHADERDRREAAARAAEAARREVAKGKELRGRSEEQQLPGPLAALKAGLPTVSMAMPLGASPADALRSLLADAPCIKRCGADEEP
mmetsp:Transcript_121566/g.388978  ORF Transcript_121566/g.388978 Transcript_121566/m.388978 type:complete len:845 (+) Transcript_121566:126-2660(+)